VQAALGGLCIEVGILRLSYRYDVSLGICLLVLTGIAGVGLVSMLSHRSSLVFIDDRRSFVDRTRDILLVLLPGLIIVFAPALLSDAITWQNVGPDFDGNLISTSYLADRHSFSAMMKDFSSAAGTSDWWIFHYTPYTHPDFRAVVGLEFFVRSLRVGHALLSLFLTKTVGVPIWLSFCCLCIAGVVLTSLVISDSAALRTRSRWLALGCVWIIVGSQNYALMMYEGINIQLIEMPVLAFLLLNWREILIKPISVWQRLFIAILLSAMISTFGEGIQIVAVFAVCAFVAAAAVRDVRELRGALSISGALQIAILTLLIGPGFTLDFILWTYGRLQEGFIGGALHREWSVLSVLFSVPAVVVGKDAPVSLVFESSFWGRLGEVAALFILGMLLRKRRPTFSGDSIAVALTMFVFCLTGHAYAAWKVAVILQPLMLIAAVAVMPRRVAGVRSIHIVGAYATFVVISAVGTTLMYSQTSTGVHSQQFSVDRSLTRGQSFAVLTPSQNRVYLRVATTGDFFWINDGWRRDAIEPNFKIQKSDGLLIALYYDCDAEGRERCAIIEGKTDLGMRQRTFIPLSLQVSDILRPDGYVDHAKANALIQKSFGVTARGGEAPTE